MKTMKMMKKKGTYEKGKGLAQVIKEAKKTWKKGGAEDAMPAPAPAAAPAESIVSETREEEGGRRRRRGGKKTRRVRKH